MPPEGFAGTNLAQRGAALAAEVAGHTADARGAAALDDGIQALWEAGEQGEGALVGPRVRLQLVFDLGRSIQRSGQEVRQAQRPTATRDMTRSRLNTQPGQELVKQP